MEINFFGHNCFLLKGKHVNILIDPWFSAQGAFMGSWYQWPVNHHFLPDLVQHLSTDKQTYLYISHEHQDHFDIETLRYLQPFIAKCCIPDYDDVFLAERLSEMKYEVIKLVDTEKLHFGDNEFIELLIVDTGVNHDSTAIISLDGECFVNQNDCKIFDRLSHLSSTKVDYYAVQFSGATWHPVCYEMSASEKSKISKKKVLSKLVAVRDAISMLEPTVYIPSAGPAVFPHLVAELSLGQDNIFVHQPALNKFLRSTKTKVVFPRPGEIIDKNSNQGPINPPTPAELNELKQQFPCWYDDLPPNDLFIPDLIKQIQTRVLQIEDLVFDDCPVILFNWMSKGIEINLNDKSVNIFNPRDYQYPQKYFMVTAEEKYFQLMADQKFRWQDIYLSLRAKIKRVPDVFNTFVNIFLFSDSTNIRSGFVTTLSINDERIVVVNRANGKNYEINRYCPHNGADLIDAQITPDGKLICPRHAWRFDLRNSGDCDTADATINSKEIKNVISLCESIAVRLTE